MRDRTKTIIAGAVMTVAGLVVVTPVAADGGGDQSACPSRTEFQFKIDNVNAATFVVPSVDNGWIVIGVSVKAGNDEFFVAASSGDVIGPFRHDISHVHICKIQESSSTTTTAAPTTTSTTTTTTTVPATSTTAAPTTTAPPPTSTTTAPTTTSVVVTSTTVGTTTTKPSTPTTTTSVPVSVPPSSPPSTEPPTTISGPPTAPSSTPPSSAAPPTSSPATTDAEPTTTQQRTTRLVKTGDNTWRNILIGGGVAAVAGLVLLAISRRPRIS